MKLSAFFAIIAFSASVHADPDSFSPSGWTWNSVTWTNGNDFETTNTATAVRDSSGAIVDYESSSQVDPVRNSTYGFSAINSYTNSQGDGRNDVYNLGQLMFTELYYTNSSGQAVQENIVGGQRSCYAYGTADSIDCD
ncbi:MAG: hypothetical protein K2X47_02550 [Bdellovibrionales bacterium]|nr:hypothetical protein [Bdellovibrionales bacterium]